MKSFFRKCTVEDFKQNGIAVNEEYILNRLCPKIEDKMVKEHLRVKNSYYNKEDRVSFHIEIN